MLVGAFVAPRSLLIVSEKGNGHPVAPEPRCRCAGTAMALRRNRDAVAPERRCRCAGTATPLRRNGRGCKNRIRADFLLFGAPDKLAAVEPCVAGFQLPACTSVETPDSTTRRKGRAPLYIFCILYTVN